MRYRCARKSDNTFHSQAWFRPGRPLIAGDEPADLRIDHGLDVSPMASYEAKKLDTDYFTE